MENEIVLDSGFSTSVYCNKRYCTGITEVTNPMDIQTNGGKITISKSCIRPKMGQVIFAIIHQQILLD